MQQGGTPAYRSWLAPGVLVAGRYRLLRPLGRGGMGSVWAAYHLGLNSEVALKFVELDAGDRDGLLARFRNEAMAVAHVKSSNVISVIDYGFDEALGRPYLAMELLSGESLGARLEREGRLPLHEVVDIVRQACRGLGRAHAAGIVHRDVKPDNLFLCPEEDTVVVKVLDFGVAKASALSGGVACKTAAGSLIGTPMYMSPEQALGGRPIDHRSDLFSLGVVAYHCLTGRPPFMAAGLGDLLVAIGTRPFPLPRGINPDLPAAVEQWLCRALEKDPALRFWSAREMASALIAASGLAPHEGPRAPRPLAPTYNDAEPISPARPLFPPGINALAPLGPTLDEPSLLGQPATFAGSASARGSARSSARSVGERPELPMRRLPVLALAGTAAVALTAGLLVTLLQRGTPPGPAVSPGPPGPPARTMAPVASPAPRVVPGLRSAIATDPAAPPSPSAPPPASAPGGRGGSGP